MTFRRLQISLERFTTYEKNIAPHHCPDSKRNGAIWKKNQRAAATSATSAAD
jgi:hypothetical protein